MECDDIIKLAKEFVSYSEPKMSWGAILASSRIVAMPCFRGQHKQ